MSIKRESSSAVPQKIIDGSVKLLRSVLNKSKKYRNSDQIAYDLRSHKLNKAINKKLKNHIHKHSDSSNKETKWICSACTYQNLGCMTYCEICERPRESEEKKAELEKESNHFNDEQIAKQLQIELEAKEKAKKIEHQQRDEWMAQKLQLEHEREKLRLEREEMANERSAMLIYEQEQKEHSEYLQKKKAEEEKSRMLIEMEKNKGLEEDAVMKLFHSTVPNRQIISIDRVAENAKNEIYEKILSEKMKDGKSRNQIERYLWHGTKNINNINLIINNGFDRSFNRTMAFGKGTYFARDASYSVNGYCGADREGVFYILLCKVIVGEYTKGRQSYTSIPKKPDNTEYDCMVNHFKEPTIFVIWRDYHAQPAYLIKFR